MHKRVCPVCGAAFMPRYGTQVCCGDDCQRARNKRVKAESRDRCAEAKRKTIGQEREEKARRRAAFFAARDRAFERAGLPIPKIVVRNGVRIESRGVIAGRPSGRSSLQISSKSYYFHS